MPETTSFEVNVTVVTEVRDWVSQRPLLKVVTHGHSTTRTGTEGLPKAVAPALANALADSANLIDNYRKADRDA